MAESVVERSLQNGDLAEKATKVFRTLNATNSGYLSWNSGEIKAFICYVFQELGLDPPPDRDVYDLYSRFDADLNCVLDLNECLRFVETLARNVYCIDSSVGASTDATTTSTSLPPALPWAVELSLAISSDTDQTCLLGTAKRMDKCVSTSLKQAVDLLNKEDIPEDFCTAYSESAGSMFLLYRRGKHNEALSLLGRASHFSPGRAVARAWKQAHEKLADSQARVPREVFVDFCMTKAPPDTPKKESYIQFVNALFDAGTALMLPSQKMDLGKHCFGYAELLANEFYFNKPMDYLHLVSDPKPTDHMVAVRDDLDADWAQVTKDTEGRVSLESFMSHYLQKFADRLVPESHKAYEAFLEQDFRAALAMMLPTEKNSLGGHCFRYAGLMAGEFYFDAAKDAVTGCGCSTPVSDVLGVTK